MHLAAINGHPNVVKLLLDHGAPVWERDNEGCNVLDTAIQFSQKYALTASTCAAYISMS